MCAIAGQLSFQKSITKSTTKLMLSRMRHRGPDDQGFHQGKHIILGMNRLSIIDVNGGKQPIYNEDRTKIIVGNGEIYNFKTVRKSLFRKHNFSTGSDIEVALHAFEEYGIGFVKHLRGMFAIAIYDQPKQQLILARDRLGEKPIFYTLLNDQFYFASELKAILSVPGINKDLDHQQLHNYFYYQYIPEAKTPFTNIHKLPAAHYLTVDQKTGKLQQKKYWSPEKINPIMQGDPTKHFRDLLEESVALTSYADVEVGVSLSGGLDSGTILALYANQKNTPISAITIGYESNSKYDETPIARQLTSSKNIEHHVHKLKTSDVVKNFPRMVYASDEPIADIAGSAIMTVSEIAHKKNLKVLLGGLGGDELFWGYAWARQATQQNVASPQKQFVFFDQTQPFKQAQKILSKFFQSSFTTQVDQNRPANLFQPDSRLSSETIVAKHSLDCLRDYWLIPNCVELNDRLSMANSVELRAPFLDYQLFTTAYQSTQNLNAYNFPHKYWMKQAVRDLFDPKILDLPKQGFTPPVGVWLFKIIHSYAYLFKNGFLSTQKIFTPNFLDLIFSMWMVAPKLWSMIYTLLVLELWGRIYVLEQPITSLKPKYV